MDFKKYQKLSRRTAIYPNRDKDFVYPVLGLVGEAGEVAEKIKRVFREKNGIIDEETKTAVQKELGDVLWYLAQLATVLGLSLDQIASDNIAKLSARKNRGTLKGSGDSR